MRRNELGDYIPSAAEATAIALATMQNEEPPAPVPETPADVVLRLEAELQKLQARADALHTATTNGDVQAATGCDLQDLTIQIATLKGELKRARESAAEAERQSSDELREQRERDYQQNVEFALKARVDIRRLYRDLAVAMGILCNATERAIQLNHELRAHCPFPDVEQTNQLRDLENRASLLPLNDLRDAGYRTLMGYGFDFSISVPPLTAPEKRNSNGS